MSAYSESVHPADDEFGQLYVGSHLLWHQDLASEMVGAADLAVHSLWTRCVAAEVHGTYASSQQGYELVGDGHHVRLTTGGDADMLPYSVAFERPSSTAPIEYGLRVSYYEQPDCWPDPPPDEWEDDVSYLRMLSDAGLVSAEIPIHMRLDDIRRPLAAVKLPTSNAESAVATGVTQADCVRLLARAATIGMRTVVNTPATVQTAQLTLSLAMDTTPQAEALLGEQRISLTVSRPARPERRLIGQEARYTITATPVGDAAVVAADASYLVLPGGPFQALASREVSISLQDGHIERRDVIGEMSDGSVGMIVPAETHSGPRTLNTWELLNELAATSQTCGPDLEPR